MLQSSHLKLSSGIVVLVALTLYDGPSVKEKNNFNLFSLPFIRRENRFKYFFTPVYWGEKINLNLFSLPFIGERN